MRKTTRTPALILAAVVLTGCGTQTGSGSGSEATSDLPEDAVLFGECRADDPALDGGDVVAEADVDGDGAMNEVAHVATGTGGPCAGALFTTFAGTPSATPLPDSGLERLDVVQLQDSERQLLLVRGTPHPRGGFDLTLYGGENQKLGPVLANGGPLPGFVATDGTMPPAGASCTADGGIETVTSVAHEPPGIILAWDLTTTTYELDGNTATQVKVTEREAVADPTLRREQPDLYDPEAYFAGCVTGS